MRPERISIIGVGLLGGSLGLAAKAAWGDCQVVGYAHRAATRQAALEIGAIDRAAESLEDAVAQSDLVVLCTPVGILGQMLEEIAPHLAEGTIVTDVGSTKRSVVELAESRLPRGAHFVGSHPMAGSEKRGVEFARTDLFRNALCILTPTARTERGALSRVEEFWQAIGMHITRLSPQEHDRLLADVSHLPHALAAALVAMQQKQGLDLAGKGFLDTTRIAGGDGNLWRDILLDNRDNLRVSLKRLKSEIAKLEKMLAGGDGEGLARWLDAAAGRREGVLRRKLGEVTPD